MSIVPDLTSRHWGPEYFFLWKTATVHIQASVAISGPAATPNPPDPSSWGFGEGQEVVQELSLPARSTCTHPDHCHRQDSVVPSQDFTGGSSCPWELLEGGIELVSALPVHSHMSQSVGSGPCSWEKGAIK